MKLRNPLDEPKGHQGLAAWRGYSKISCGGVQGMLEGQPPPGPPLIPSQFLPFCEGSRKTPGTPGARKRQAGRLARFVLDCIHSETRGSLHWTK